MEQQPAETSAKDDGQEDDDIYICDQQTSKEQDSPAETEKLPMSGVRVIDVGTFLAGPYAASILGEFGAEVLKVEHPIAGDPMRRFGTPTKRHDATLAWLSEGRNRKSVTIDLRQKEGVELFLKLVAKSDILVENFRPGTMEEWGLGWQVLSEANPGLVMLRVSGYGQTGPYRRRSGFAHIARVWWPVLSHWLPRRNASPSRHNATWGLYVESLRSSRRHAGLTPPGEDWPRTGDRYRDL
jgi:hypothetical protein